MAQPIVKYTLNKKGQTPEWINSSDSSFAGQHGITGNKTGYIPRYESPQDTVYLGSHLVIQILMALLMITLEYLQQRPYYRHILQRQDRHYNIKQQQEQSLVFRLQQQLDYRLHGIKKVILGDYQHQQPQSTQLLVLEQLQPYLHHK